MGKTYQADIPGNKFETVFDLASAATNAGSVNTFGFEAPADIIVTGVTYTPTGKNGIGHATTYRTLTLRDGGADSTGTVAAATYALTATLPSNVPADFTVTSSLASIDSGDVLMLYHVANTTAATHTELAAGKITVRYRLQ